MAEFALGLTKTAVEGTLSSVRLAIEEEATLQVRVQQDLVFIRGEFQMMQSFLNVANSERAKNEVVRTWVRQIRDLAFDVEDCVDFVVHLDRRSSWDWLWRLVPSFCGAPPPPLDVAVAQIQQLKARVEDVSHRNTRYNLIGGSNSSSAAAAVSPASSCSTTTSSAFRILNKVWEAAGRKRGDMGDLRKLITSEGNDLQVISVWGSTGGAAADLAVTNIIRKAYNHPEVCQEFRIRAWVKLGRPFDHDEFLRSLVTQFYPMEPSVARAYQASLLQQVNRHRCLVILQDVSTQVEWDAIRTYLPVTNTGSRIVVSAKQLGMALSCPGDPYQVSELKRFSGDQSICAFFKKDSGRRRSDMGEFKWQIRRRGVVSVWGLENFASSGISTLYKDKAMSDESEGGLGFNHQSWIDVPDTFNRIVFARSLVASSYPPDETDEDGAAYSMQWEEVLARCRKFLSEDDCIIVINGLQSTDYWDSIKTTFLSGSPIKCCILVTTGEKSIATHCADHEYRAFNIDDSILYPLTASGRRCSDMGKFRYQMRRRGVVSVWGLRGFASTVGIRGLYGGEAMSNELEVLGFKRRSWIDVPGPFDKTVFARSLVASSDPQYGTDKHGAAYSMQWEEVLARCRKFLSEDDCIIVINGLQSTDYWDSIRTTFLSEPTKCCILVTTEEKSVATHCAYREYRAFNIDDLVLREEDPHDLVPRQDNVTGQAAAVVLRPLITTSGHRSGIAELIWQLRCCGVISVWGAGNGNSGTGNGNSRTGNGGSILIDRVYKGTRDKLKEFDGVEFDWHSWIDLAEPFDLAVFPRLLCENLQSDSHEIKAKVAREVIDEMKLDKLIERCSELLSEDDGFIVINGLQCKEDWNLIQGIFGTKLTSTKACIVVITDKATVARHCVKHEYQALNIKDLESDDALGLFQKGWQLKEETSQSERCLVCNRSEEALKWEKEFKLFGRKNETFKLEDRLKSRGVISVWGIASVGKSDLVRSSYYNRMVNVREKNPMYRDDQEFSQLDFVTYSWVDVSHPFNLSEFSQRLLLDFHSDDIGAKEAAAIAIMEGQDPIQGCCKFLREDKCFVVIDGLRSTEDWDLIKDALLAEPTTGCIVVITNEASVATHCVDHENQVINVKCLEDDAAQCLFNKLAWKDKVEKLLPEIKVLSSNTVAQCGGLPKVLAAIGQHPNMSSKNFLESTSGDFMGVLEKDPGFYGLRGLFSWMRSYFDACSDSLKPCIFYLSVFPVYKNIRRRRLLRRWIAEGYCRDTSAGSTAEETAEMFFSDLVSLSIIQQPAASSSVCQVNAFFHGYIISRQMEDNLVFALEGHCSLNSRRAGQHLTVRSNWDKDATVFKSIDFSRLRSFTVFKDWMPFFISADVNMELLRVLDLEGTSGVTHGDVEQIGKRLPHLKFLSLRGCKMISRLPDSLRFLKQLQTLDVSDTNIVKLPHVISKLRKLQYIHAGQDGHGRGTSTGSITATAATAVAAAPPPQDNGDATSTRSIAALSAAAAAPPPPQQVDGDSTSARSIAATSSSAAAPPPSPQQQGDGDATSAISIAAAAATPAATSIAVAPPPPQDGDVTSTRSIAAATTTTSASSSSTAAAATPPPQDDGDATSTRSIPAAAAASQQANSGDSTTRGSLQPANANFVSSTWCWLSNKLVRTRGRLGDSGGVEVPAGIGNLTALHTLGVVNVNGVCGEAILRELKDLTQLRELMVSGINRENWLKFCSAISCHGHLEYLSVRIDDDKEDTSSSGYLYGLSESQMLPKTLKRLKLYGGHLHRFPTWINELVNLKRLDLEISIATREDMYAIAGLTRRDILHRLCLKPSAMIQELHVCMPDDYCPLPINFCLKTLQIDCSSSLLNVTFGFWIASYVELLVVHCSSESSTPLQFSGLENLLSLKEVWLTGSYCELALKLHLEQECSQHKNTPAFKMP